MGVIGLDPLTTQVAKEGWFKVYSLSDEFKASLILMRSSQNSLMAQDWVQAPASEVRDMTNFYSMKNKLLKHFLNCKFTFMVYKKCLFHI